MKEQLQELRKGKNLTQEEAAELFGVKLSTYQKYERDAISPSYETLIKIADFYGVTTDYLLGREKAPDPFGDLELSTEDEQEVFRKYMSLPENVRAIMLDVLLQLGEAARARQAAEQSEIVETTTAGELHARMDAQADSEETAG